MKRKLSLIVLVAMLAAVCFGVLAACNGDSLDDYSLTTLLSEVNKLANGAQGKTSCTLSKTVSYQDVDGTTITGNIKWSAVGENVTLTEGDDSVTISVASGVTSYILKGALINGKGVAYEFDGNPVEKAITVSTGNNGGDGGNGDNGGDGGNQGGDNTGSALDQLKANAVSSLTAGANYKLVMWQGDSTVNKILYATATMSGNFLSATDNAANAAIVTAETATGGFHLALTGGSSKNYIKFTDNSTDAKTPKAKIELVSSSADASVFTIGEHNAPVASVTNALSGSDSNFFLGSHGSYQTFSATSTFYFTNQSGSVVVDSSQWVGRLIPAGTTINGGDGGNQGGNTNPGGDGGNQGGSTVEGSTVTVDFAQNFATYAGSWNNSYTTLRTVTASDLGLSGINLTIEMNASKQDGKNVPVVASKSDTCYVTVKVTDKTISSATFNLSQWSDAKKFTELKLEYSVDGTTWTDANVGVSDANGIVIGETRDLACQDLPAGVTMVRFVFTPLEYASDSGKLQNQQILLKGLVLILN